MCRLREPSGGIACFVRRMSTSGPSDPRLISVRSVVQIYPGPLGKTKLRRHLRCRGFVASIGLERRVARGGRDSIDHGPDGRDDVANAAVGACVLVGGAAVEPIEVVYDFEEVGGFML